MAVAFDAATESVRTGTTDPHTFTHTPVGTPRGVIVTVVHGTESTNLVTGITYGGVPMTFSTAAADTATEPGRAAVYFLGSGIPTGPQTVSIDMTSATTTDVQFVCMTVTASADTSVQDWDSLSNNAANPSLALQYGALNGMGFAALYGGGASPADATPLSGCATVHDHDFGAFYAEVIRQSTLSSGDFTIGLTAASDDVAFVAIGVTDAANVTIDLDTANIIASAVAAPATPDGSDVTVGPSAADSTASGRPTQQSTPSGTVVTPSAAAATASVATPDGLDKAIGVPSAQATANPGEPVMSGTASGDDKTISLSGLRASATAAPATPDGGDVHVGPSAAAAAASVVAPSAVGVGGSFTVVNAVAALAHAPDEGEPLPWEDVLGSPPVVEVTVSPSAAASVAVGGTHTPVLTLTLATRAGATASGNTTLVGRPIQATAAAAAADGGVPDNVGEDTGSRDVSPTAASASASVVAPSVSVSINAPQATASGALLGGATLGVTVPVTASAAIAGVVAPVTEITITPSAAAAATALLHPAFVLTGSALVRPPVALAVFACDRPRSVGVKNFVSLIPRPSEDTRTMVPVGAASTLVLTPMEEQTE